MPRCHSRTICAALAFVATLLSAPPPAGCAPLTLLLFDRPPYYRLHDGHPAGGFLLILAQAAFDRAALDYVVQDMPPPRILATLRRNATPACAVGWFRTPEREGFARYSRPLYTDKPLGVALGTNSPACPPQASLARLLHEKYRWGLRPGFSYGPSVDAALAALPPERVHRVAEPGVLLPLLARGRLDAVLIEPEEFAWLASQDPQNAPRTRLCSLSDTPSAPTRYIICDAAVPEADLARLDAAIDELVGERAQEARHLLALRH